jgi:hypothetical protein
MHSDLKNVPSLQTEVATAVTQALQATLLADAATDIEVGRTQNPAAFDAYLRGKGLKRVQGQGAYACADRCFPGRDPISSAICQGLYGRSERAKPLCQ